MRSVWCVTLAATTLLLGCEGTLPTATAPTLGGANTAVTGGAGGAQSQGQNSALERCGEPLGTLAVLEDQTSV